MIFRFTIILAFLTATSTLFFSCKKKENQDVCTLKDVESEPPADSVALWLIDIKNHDAENYDSIFNDLYDKMMREENYIGASDALASMLSKEAYRFAFTESTYNKAIEFKEKYGNKFPAQSLVFLDSYFGNYHTDKGDFKRSIPYFKRILKFRPTNRKTCTEIASANYDLGYSYISLGNQASALKYTHEALNYYRRAEDTIGIASAYGNIALINMFTKNYQDAEYEFNRAIEFYKNVNDTGNILTTMHNKILLYEEMNSPLRYKLIDSNYRFMRTYGGADESNKISVNTFYVTKLLHDGDYKKAKQILDETKIYVDRIDSPFSTIEYQVALAEYQIETSSGIVDTKQIEEALKAVEEFENYQTQVSFNKVLKEDARVNGNFERALFYAEKEAKAVNKLAERTMIVKTLEYNKKHQIEKKQQYIELQQKSLENKNTAIALLFVAIIAFILGLAVYLSVIKQKKIRYEKERSQHFTRQLLEKTEEERKRIAGDLHDSVSHELLSLKNDFGQQNPANGKIDNIINVIRIISRNLHPIMFEKVGLKASVEQLAERGQSIHDLMVTAEVNYDSSLRISTELQVYRIIQEALSNTIKYAGAVAAKITIETYLEYILIEVKDNGKGFNVDEMLDSKNAFGLLNILERTKAIGGTAKIHSDSHGTIITITIKK